jgi:hypothetical protein
VIAVEAETDGTLIERSCRGRPDAFVEVVRRHEAAVHGFLAKISTQERALESTHDLRGFTRWQSWGIGSACPG